MDEERDKREKIIKSIKSSIIRDNKQIRVSIPAEFGEAFNINEKTDLIVWSVRATENNELSLEAKFVKEGRTNEKTEN
jgi:hypothetical protein